MLKDRGSIKWTSLMLPEHVELLKEMWQENKKVSKPMIDTQMVETLEIDLIEAYKNEQYITVYYFDHGYIKQVIGKVASFNTYDNEITCKLGNDQADQTILFHQIISIC